MLGLNKFGEFQNIHALFYPDYTNAPTDSSKFMCRIEQNFKHTIKYVIPNARFEAVSLVIWTKWQLPLAIGAIIELQGKRYMIDAYETDIDTLTVNDALYSVHPNRAYYIALVSA